MGICTWRESVRLDGNFLPGLILSGKHFQCGNGDFRWGHLLDVGRYGSLVPVRIRLPCRDDHPRRRQTAACIRSCPPQLPVGRQHRNLLSSATQGSPGGLFRHVITEHQSRVANLHFTVHFTVHDQTAIRCWQSKNFCSSKGFFIKLNGLDRVIYDEMRRKHAEAIGHPGNGDMPLSPVR